MSVTEAIAAIADGPKGPGIGAFFDFDGTLIDGFSALAYFTDKLRRRKLGLREAADIIRTASAIHDRQAIRTRAGRGS